MSGQLWGTRARLGEPDWAEALESIAARCAGRPTTLLVLAPGVPESPGAGPYPLRSITYDARSREVRVGLGAPGAEGPALRCFIPATRDLAVAEDAERITVVVSGGGRTRTLIEVSARRRGRGASAQGEPPVAFRRLASRWEALHGGCRAV